MLYFDFDGIVFIIKKMCKVNIILCCDDYFYDRMILERRDMEWEFL